MEKEYTYAIIGDPVEHSRSPEIYAPMFISNGIEAKFLRLRLKSDEICCIRDVVSEYKLSGFAVTMPHKKTIFEYLDEISPEARDSGSVNIVTIERDESTASFRQPRLIGHNTDGDGIVNALIEANVEVSGKLAVILGAGGAAAGAVEAITRRHGRAATITRSREFSLYDAIDRSSKLIAGCDILINATPLGMYGFDEFETLNFLSLMKPGSAAVDMVYAVNASSDLNGAPQPTRFVLEAKKRGLVSFGGDRMLYHQGVLAFRLWTGITGSKNNQQCRA